MKKTCHGCRALERINDQFRCDLGKEIEQKYSDNILIGAQPKEKCPKPTTYRLYLLLKGY